jgi:phage gpG-like protein
MATLIATIDGLPELLASIDQFGEDVAECIDKQVAIAAINIQGAAKYRAPVLKVPRRIKGALYSGGRLRKSINVYHNTEGPASAEVRAEVDYAAPVEFGHRTSAGTFVPAQPFMTPAVEGEGPRFWDRLTAALNEVIGGAGK